MKDKVFRRSKNMLKLFHPIQVLMNLTWSLVTIMSVDENDNESSASDDDVISAEDDDDSDGDLKIVSIFSILSLCYFLRSIFHYKGC